MYTKYSTYNLLMAIGPHVYNSQKIIKTKKNEIILQCSTIKSTPLSSSIGFFFKKMLIYINCSKSGQKNIFGMDFQSKF
jgi:hypothetical protein